MRKRLVLLISIIVLLIAGVFSYAYMASFYTEVADLRLQAKLDRAVLPGRSVKDVVEWLGPPDRIAGAISTLDKRKYKVYIYKSTAFRTKRLNGNENLWIVFDKQDRIVVTYYPDSPQESANRDRNYREAD